MSTPLRAPNDRYSVAIDVLSSVDGESYTRQQVSQGVGFWDIAGQDGAARREEARGGARPHSYLVVVGEACSLVLLAGENGLTLRSVKLMNACHALIRAVVTARGGAPDWLPTESVYLLFEGDRAAEAAFRERFIPLEGMAAESPAPPDEETTPLDRLAVAVGRSVARANAALARSQAAAGVALVSSVTIRVAVDQTDLGQGRVLVTLARPGQGQTGQFVELTMTTVPGEQPEGEAEGAPDGQQAERPRPSTGQSLGLVRS